MGAISKHAGEFTMTLENGKTVTRYFGVNTNAWSRDQGFPFELQTVSIHGNPGVRFSKTRAYVCVDESADGGCVTETWAIRGLKMWNNNPTPRIKKSRLSSQPSQLTGDAPSPRLVKRRKATAKQAMPGVWANPLTRVKVNSPSQRGDDLSPRLKARRKTTKAAPAGFYANPKTRTLYCVWTAAADGVKHEMLAHFPLLKNAKDYAQSYADASGKKMIVEGKKL